MLPRSPDATGAALCARTDGARTTSDGIGGALQPEAILRPSAALYRALATVELRWERAGLDVAGPQSLINMALTGRTGGALCRLRGQLLLYGGTLNGNFGPVLGDLLCLDYARRERDAMAASAIHEGEMFEGHTSPLATKKLSYAKKKRRGKKASGFSAPFAAESLLEEGLTVHELRSRLLGYGLSTTGIKAELRARLEEAMLHFRAQHKTWDSEKMAWV